MTNSATVPKTETLGGYIRYPYNVEYYPATDDKPAGYNFDEKLIPVSGDSIKDSINLVEAQQAAIQEAGMTCTNGIKLQVREIDLSRWTQLVATITAFQPETVTIRDYDNVNHTVSKAEALQMMGEVAAWGQAFLAETWRLKDAILNG